MKRPKIDIQRSKLDWGAEVLSAIGVLATFGLLFFHYSELPASIPIHFNLLGKPDAYGSKSLLWISPLFSLLLYVGLSAQARFPHTYNYLVRITEENARRQYRNAIWMLNILKVLIVWMIGYVTLSIMLIAVGKMVDMGAFVMPSLLLFIISTTGFFIYRGYKIG